MNNAKIIRDTERFLKRTTEYKECREEGWAENYVVDIILQEGTNPGGLPHVIALATCEDMELMLFPYENESYATRPFDFDSDFFQQLEEGYEIVALSDDTHTCIWYALEEHAPESMEHQKGLQMYLGYCKKNNITSERIGMEHDLYTDFMALYDGKTMPATTHKPRHNDAR